jgi:hypothetical protein
MARRQKQQDTLDAAYSIASEYNGNLTVRQLYYQLVARGFIPNSAESYKRLVCILTDARLSGEFPFEWIIDRTREARTGSFHRDQTDIESALRSAAHELRQAPESWIWRDRWYGQPYHVSVWVEKEALAGVFEVPCENLGVAWFVLRGYSPLSALSSWVDNLFESTTDTTEEAIVLYFGDHDPDGWEIPRSAERNIEAISCIRRIDLPPVSFRRIALIREQIEEFNPPPFPAKETSSRFDSYVSEHQLRDAWELDALRPEVLEDLIRNTVLSYFDAGIHQENLSIVQSARNKMRNQMKTSEWIKTALGE